MTIRSPMQLLAAVRRRLARVTELTILRAGAVRTPPDPLPGFDLVSVSLGAGAEAESALETAMELAGEPAGLVDPRLRHGDDFFGWRQGGQIVCFGWATYRDRFVGNVELDAAPCRAFLYNFHTLEPFRGRGLYPGLLATMMYELGLRGTNEFIIDVNVTNRSSLRGILKAGFQPVGRVRNLTAFSHWTIGLPGTDLAALSREGLGV